MDKYVNALKINRSPYATWVSNHFLAYASLSEANIHTGSHYIIICHIAGLLQDGWGQRWYIYNIKVMTHVCVNALPFTNHRTVCLTWTQIILKLFTPLYMNICAQFVVTWNGIEYITQHHWISFVIRRLRCYNQISRACTMIICHVILCDVITYQCPRNLLLAPKSWYIIWISIWLFILPGWINGHCFSLQHDA